MTHAMISSPFHRVARLKAHFDDGTKTGSGYLLSDHLVLTALHVVDHHGDAANAVDVEFLSGAQTTAALEWSGASSGLDAALLKVDDPPVDPNGTRLTSVRWGRLTGPRTGIAASAMGFPRVLRTPGGERVADHVSGRINPGVALGERYDVQLDAGASECGAISPWQGLSGGALRSDNGLLIGVMVVHQADVGRDTLTAVPAWKLLAEEEFRESLAADGCTSHCEAFELLELFVSPVRLRGELSPARLLAPEAEVVPFRGREDVLADLVNWCASREKFAARVVTGPGGQGKTRLALELMRRMRADGWVAGMVDPTARGVAIRAVPETCVPLLLVVDYAETRAPQLERLVKRIWDGDPQTPIRILMLARAAGDWWKQLARNLPDALAEDDESEIALSSLEDDVSTRDYAYREAVSAFAKRLARDQGAYWSSLGETVRAPSLAARRFASALTLHMTALGALLQLGRGRVRLKGRRRPEDLLLAHEQRYWNDAAAARGLAPHPDTLRLAVAASALCGAASRAEATATLAGVPGLDREPEMTVRAVADWLHDLYGVAQDRFWGPLQPDTLGERLIEEASSDYDGLVERLLDQASDSQRELARDVVARIAARLHHDRKDAGAATWWYEAAATHGHADAAYQLGLILESHGEGEKAATWWEQAADTGHLDATFRLGETSANTEQQKRWFKLAGEQGHRHAAYNLGWLLKNDEDVDGALQWWERAADLMPEAAWYLARELHEVGNVSDARIWYERAAGHGWNNARIALGLLALGEDDLPAAGEWLQQAERDGDREAAFHLAEVRWREENLPEVRRLLEEAWSKGYLLAAYKLGCWYWDQEDTYSAREWWEKAAAENIEDAKQRLAADFPAQPATPTGVEQ